MAEYIDRAKAVDEFEQCNAKTPRWTPQRVKTLLLRIPTADVAPVVRCKDCVHWDDDPDTYGADYGPKGKCMKSFETMRADDFCSWGEREEVENG